MTKSNGTWSVPVGRGDMCDPHNRQTLQPESHIVFMSHISTDIPGDVHFMKIQQVDVNKSVREKFAPKLIK